MRNTNTIVFPLCYPFLFSFSLVLPSLVNLFKKNIHSFLTFNTTHTCHPPVILGLAEATKDPHRPPNVLESATFRPNNNSNTHIIGSIHDVVSRLDHAFLSCTETLGFESSDEIHNNAHADSQKEKKKNPDDDCDNDYDHDHDDEILRKRMIRANWKKVRSFPPPLSSLNRNGKPSFYLRPVRKDGRLELTEVRIERSEILHASRQDGRLTLHLIQDQEEEEEEVEEEKEEKEERDWRLVPTAGGGSSGEGLRRCHEMVNQQQQHHHHHHHHHHHGNLRMCGISIV